MKIKIYQIRKILAKKLGSWVKNSYILAMENEKFWDIVRKLLKKHKMTQRELAEKTYIPYGTLTRWMHFGRVPNTVSVYSIAIILGVTSNFLLGGEEKDIGERRINELAARRALAIVEDLAKKILVEAKKGKPLRKGG